IDHHAIEVIGVEAAALMETAGRAVAHEALRMMDSDVKSRRVIILVGKGNNGGDGLVAARVLHDAGAVVRVAFAGSPPSTGDGSAAANLKAATAMGIAVHACPAAADIPEFNDAELCIDALLVFCARAATT